MRIKVKTATRRAKTAPIFMNISDFRAGTKADKPYHRKNKTKQIVLNDMLHSPLVKLLLTVQT